MTPHEARGAIDRHNAAPRAMSSESIGSPCPGRIMFWYSRGNLESIQSGGREPARPAVNEIIQFANCE
jgi:hypothetical protein